MDPIITEELFNKVQMAVERVCVNSQRCPKLIITEGDLQSHIFAGLITDPEILATGVHIHNQINYLQDGQRLGRIPDITLLNPNGYDINPGGGLFNQKGYTIWGSAIAIELKLLRANRIRDFVSATIEDINKLKSLREQHYSDEHLRAFFCAQLVLCRRTLPAPSVARIEQAAFSANIPLWLFNFRPHQG